MPGPELGVLGATFTVARIMQAASLVSIIGIAANFVAQMVASNQTPPPVLIGTLVVTCVSTIYIAITYLLYLDSLLPFLLSALFDCSLLIALIVVAVTIGKPLSYLDCTVLPAATPATSASTLPFIESLNANIYKVNYYIWAGANRTTCYELKSIWGLSIALCILMAFSSVVAVCLWKCVRIIEMEKKKAEEAKKDVEQAQKGSDSESS